MRQDTVITPNPRLGVGRISSARTCNVVGSSAMGPGEPANTSITNPRVNRARSRVPEPCFVTLAIIFDISDKYPGAVISKGFPRTSNPCRNNRVGSSPPPDGLGADWKGSPTHPRHASTGTYTLSCAGSSLNSMDTAPFQHFSTHPSPLAQFLAIRNLEVSVAKAFVSGSSMHGSSIRGPPGPQRS